MEKLSKSKTPKFEVEDGDGSKLELEKMNGAPDFLLSVKNEDDDTWRCLDLTVEKLEEMAAWARRQRDG